MTRKRSVNNPVSAPTFETTATSETTLAPETTPASETTLASETTPTSETTKAAPAPKPSKAAWKTGEQLEYMYSLWSDFIAHQNTKRLARFWPRVYDGWYQRWKFTPPPDSTDSLDPLGTAELAFKRENNKVRVTISYLCTTDRPLISLIRGFARGSITRLVRPPSPAAGPRAGPSTSCVLTKPKSENLPPLKLTAPTPGISASGRSLSPVGKRRSSPICPRTRTTPLPG